MPIPCRGGACLRPAPAPFGGPLGGGKLRPYRERERDRLRVYLDRLRPRDRLDRLAVAPLDRRLFLAQQQPQDARGSRLVEGPVAVAALGRLGAGGAAVVAGAGVEE